MSPRGGAGGSPTAREDRRQALVRAAYHQIAERGFEGLRTREVAAEVQVNVATLHYYFPTKERLISGVVDYAMGRFQSTLAPHGSPVDQLARHLRAVRDLLNDEPQLSVVMGELALRSARDPEIAAIVGRMSGAWEQAVRGLLRRGVRNGHLPADRDSEEVAALIVSVLASMTLPSMGGGARTDRALRQLERWLFAGPTEGGSPRPGANSEQPSD